MSTTAQEVRNLVDRVERLHAERDAIASDIADIFSEAKSKSLDVKALKAVISYRRKDRIAVEDLAARTAEYLAMVESGTPIATRAPARESSRGGDKAANRRPGRQGITAAASRDCGGRDVNCPEVGPRETIDAETGEITEIDARGTSRVSDEPASVHAPADAGSHPLDLPACLDRRGAMAS